MEAGEKWEKCAPNSNYFNLLVCVRPSLLNSTVRMSKRVFLSEDEDEEDGYERSKPKKSFLEFTGTSSVRQTEVLESPGNVIRFHLTKCTTDGCNGSCHDSKSDVDASYDSDDPSMSSSDDSSWSGTLSGDCDNWDVDELNNGIDNDDDLMEPASEPASELASWHAFELASKPTPEAEIAELKQQCIYTIKDKLAEFPTSHREVLIERVRTAVTWQKFYWCQGMCDYHKKSLMSGCGETLVGIDRAQCPSAEFNDKILVRIAQKLETGIMFCNFRAECKRRLKGRIAWTPHLKRLSR